LNKDTCDDVRTIGGRLRFTGIIGIVIIVVIGEHIFLNLGPAGICGHGDKDIRFSAVPGDGHGVLEELVHMTGAAGVTGGQDDAFTPLSQVNVRVMPKSIPQTIVEIRPNLLLVGPVPVQLTVLYGSPSIDHILLKQPPSSKQI
jgi:hypothetical protein